MSASHTLSSSPSVLRFSSRRSLPLIMQSEATECGLACLAMIAGYFGFDTDLNTVRRRFGVSAHGINLQQMIKVASQMELTSRPLKVEMEELEQLQLPCVLHWQMNHFVVAKTCERGRLVIHDPAIGEVTFNLEEAAKLFTGIALELSPSANFETGRRKNRLTLSHFWQRIVGLKRSLSVLVWLSLMLQLVAIVNPYYIQIVIDDVILRSDLNLLTILAFGFGLLLLLELGITFVREQAIVRLSAMLNMQLASNVFARLIRLPMSYFSKRHMGDIVSRFGSVNEVREMITSGSVAVFIDGLMAILTLIVMFLYSVPLTLLVIAIVLLYAVLRALFYRPLRMASEQAIVATAKENSHFMESVRAIQTIKLFQKEALRQGQWQSKLADKVNKDIRINQWNIKFDLANKALFGLENILVVYFAAHAVTQNLLTVGMLYAFVSYKTRFIGAMDGLIANGIAFRMLNLHFERLADMIFTLPDPLLADSSNSPHCPAVTTQTLRGHVELKQLSFSYSRQDPPLFENIDLTIEAGQTVAIVGASGCGKSTLLKCVMGLLEPCNGEILIDAIPLKRLPDIRQQLAAVMQEDQLLSGTIADNIACFDSQIDVQHLYFCANLACIHDEIMSMTMQYNTLVGDMGAGLSGGQKQRIMLARALYRKPRLLFLDEATSHLDIQNESIINTHIKQLSITRIIVAHRPQTIASADKVVRLEGGRLIDESRSVNPPTHPSI